MLNSTFTQDVANGINEIVKYYDMTVVQGEHILEEGKYPKVYKYNLQSKWEPNDELLWIEILFVDPDPEKFMILSSSAKKKDELENKLDNEKIYFENYLDIDNFVQELSDSIDSLVKNYSLVENF